MKKNSTIFALIVVSSTITTTTGFQLALRTKLIKLARFKNPSSLVATSTSSCSQRRKSNDSHGQGGHKHNTNLLQRLRVKRNGRRVNQPSTTTPASPLSTNNMNKTDQIKFNKRILALTATMSFLSTLLHRPTIASAAAATTIPPLSSTALSIFDPAVLTTSSEGLSALGPTSSGGGSNKNVLVTVLVTAFSTIRMKQQAMVLYALAIGMTMALLKCAEGGYIKFVEFVAHSCLGYYGMDRSEQEEDVVDCGEEEDVQMIDWGEYVLHLPRKKEVLVEMDNDGRMVTMDKRTMLFLRSAACAYKRRDDIMMERANQFYREKQYAQHHLHSNETPPGPATSSSFHHPDTLSRSSWDEYQAALNSMSQYQATHDETSDKLQIMKNLLTWDDYKQLATELQMKKEECTKLHEEVKSLKKILQVERTVHHYDPQVSSVATKVEDEDELELKILEDKAKEYDEAIEESKVNDDSIRWH